MKLVIHSMQELHELLSMFAGAMTTYASEPSAVHIENLSTIYGGQESDIVAAMKDIAQQGETAPPKRQRRTKAQIAADEAAAQAMPSPEQAVTQAVAEGAAPLVTDAYLERMTVAEATQGFINDATVITEMTPVSPVMSEVEHIKFCREFIAVHKMAKYEQSFTLAGLPNNVLAFSDEDRAKHMAVLTDLART